MKDLQAKSHKLRKELLKLQDMLRAEDFSSVDSLGASSILAQERSEWASALQLAGTTLDAQLERARASAEQIEAAYPSRLRTAIEGAGLATEGDDLLLVVEGVVFVTVEAKTGRVDMNGRTVAVAKVEGVTAAVLAECSDLRSKSTAPREFLRQLRSAYLREVAVQGKADGVQVETISLLPHLAILRQSPAFMKNPLSKSFKEYPLPLFRADLHALLLSGETQVDSRQFRFGAGATTNGALFMYVPSMNRASYVARVWFEVRV